MPRHPSQGPGLHGNASGKPAKAFSATNQPPGAAKQAGLDVRAAWRERLTLKLGAVEAVYDAALVDPDRRVGLVAARQISAELWPASVEVAGKDGGPLTVVLRRFVEDVPGE